jgi:hypothetical protein
LKVTSRSGGWWAFGCYLSTIHTCLKMTKYLLLPLLALALPAVAQHTELIGRAGAGLMQFGGASAVGTSFVNYATDYGYTNSPYGSKLGTGFALGGRVQRVGGKGGLLVLDLGYESLRSRTAVTSVFYSSSMLSSYVATYSANGSTNLQSQALTALLGLGHRFSVGNVEVDAVVGPELAYITSLREKGSGTYDGGKTWTTSLERGSRAVLDPRLRADATVWCHQFGFSASYSYGFRNYLGGMLGGASPEAYARVLRLGLAYRLQ